jgi:hypothetical protein
MGHLVCIYPGLLLVAVVGGKDEDGRKEGENDNGRKEGEDNNGRKEGEDDDGRKGWRR